MDKACGYIRVSTEGQAKQGYSLKEQREEIIRYCQENDLALEGIFSDEGISGAKAHEEELCIDREGLMDMLATIKINNIQYVVVLSTSRLWRSDMVKVLIDNYSYQGKHNLRSCHLYEKQKQFSIYSWRKCGRVKKR